MDLAFFGVQLLNGLQYGLLLFLIASGLTLIFGIMGIINLAHGAMYMIGAYLVYDLTFRLGNFWLAILVAIPIAIALGLIIERLFLDTLYKRDHLYQVLLTFGLISLGERALLRGIAAILCALPAAWLFVRNEARAPAPMMPPSRVSAGDCPGVIRSRS